MLGLHLSLWTRLVGGGAPAETFYILAETADRLTTEAGDGLITE